MDVYKLDLKQMTNIMTAGVGQTINAKDNTTLM